MYCKVWVFFLHFIAQPLLGLDREEASLLMKFTSSFWRIWNLPISRILFLQGVSSNNLDFMKNIEGSALFLKATLWFYVSDFFEKALKLSANLMDIFAQAGGFILSIFIGGLCSYFWVVVHPAAFLWRYFWRARARPLLPCATGTPKLSEGLTCDCKKCSWKAYSWLLV